MPAAPAERRVAASAGPNKPTRGTDFGFLGMFGGLLVVLAGGVLFWSIRS